MTIILSDLLLLLFIAIKKKLQRSGQIPRSLMERLYSARLGLISFFFFNLKNRDHPFLLFGTTHFFAR